VLPALIGCDAKYCFIWSITKASASPKPASGPVSGDTKPIFTVPPVAPLLELEPPLSSDEPQAVTSRPTAAVASAGSRNDVGTSRGLPRQGSPW
jgi:hypothetical protein